MTTVSVILPTFNRASVLRRALVSVLSQTRTPDQVIVVDDASTDNTADVVRLFPGVEYIKLERNAGAAGARNHGVSLATGDYIAFQDSDDLWLANKLEVQLAYLERQPSVDMLCSGVTVKSRSGKVEHFGYGFNYPAGGWTLAHLQNYAFSTPTWLIKRTAFLAAGGFDETLPNCEDLDFLARILKRHRLEIVADPLVVKYNQADSLDANFERLSESYLILMDRHRDLWQQAPIAAERVWMRMANVYLARDNIQKGREALKAVVSIRPLSYKVWILLALTYLGSPVFNRIRRTRKTISDFLRKQRHGY